MLILYVSGINIIVKNAGTACSKLVKSICLTFLNMKMPTTMSAGAVANDGTIAMTGVTRSAAKKRSAITILVSPVLPPSAIPDPDSMYVVVVLVPKSEPATVAIASAPRILSIFSMDPSSFTILASKEHATIVPTESKRSTNIKEKMAPHRLHFKALAISSCRNIGEREGAILTLVFHENGGKRYIGDIDLFKKALMSKAKENYYKQYGKKSLGSNKNCFVCNERKSEVFGFVNTYNFYTVDKPGFVTGGFDQKNAWKNYPVCLECSRQSNPRVGRGESHPI